MQLELAAARIRIDSTGQQQQLQKELGRDLALGRCRSSWLPLQTARVILISQEVGSSTRIRRIVRKGLSPTRQSTNQAQGSARDQPLDSTRTQRRACSFNDIVIVDDII